MARIVASPELPAVWVPATVPRYGARTHEDAPLCQTQGADALDSGLDEQKEKHMPASREQYLLSQIKARERRPE